jgi:nucleoside-diphosphate-sugar epimerase
MREKILLTGATGFLGSHILKKLIEENYEVVILIRETSKLDRINSLDGFTIFKIDPQCSNFDELFELHSIDTIIHLATEYGRKRPYSEVLISNVYFPVKLIEAGLKKNLKVFINTDSYFSKFPEYQYLKEYTSTKKILKDYLKLLLDVKIINLQLEHLYGENDSKEKFFPMLIEKLLKNIVEIELTDGCQKRDFIYVEDVVEAYMIVLKNRDKLDQFSEFEVGTGVSIPLKDFVIKVRSILNSDSNFLFGAIPTRPNEIEDSKASNQSLVNLGWKTNSDIKINQNNFLRLYN